MTNYVIWCKQGKWVSCLIYRGKTSMNDWYIWSCWNMDANLVFRDKVENLFSPNLMARDENENLFHLIFWFEMRSRNWKWVLVVEREKITPILMIIFEIEISRRALVQALCSNELIRWHSIIIFAYHYWINVAHPCLELSLFYVNVYFVYFDKLVSFGDFFLSKILDSLVDFIN